MKVPFINLQQQYLDHKDEFAQAIQNVLDNSAYILGDVVASFEDKMSDYLNIKSISCASGSDALLLALMARDIGPGDEVITTPFTFFATAGAAARLGAKPVFVDIDPKTFNIDPDKVEAAITKNTKAIIPVHLFGQSSKMDDLMNIADRHNLTIIEDACQAIGAEYKGKKVGAIGDFGCFSFYPTKNLGGFGDGGLITCKSKKDYELVKKLRVHGAEVKYYHDLVGFNSRLDALQAAVLVVGLKYIDELNEKRKLIAKKYDEKLSGIVETPHISDKATTVYHQYSILTDQRDELLEYLIKNEIGGGVYYPLPLHLQKCFVSLGYKEGDLPVTEEISRRILSLPIFPQMRDDELDYVVEKVRNFF